MHLTNNVATFLSHAYYDRGPWTALRQHQAASGEALQLPSHLQLQPHQPGAARSRLYWGSPREFTRWPVFQWLVDLVLNDWLTWFWLIWLFQDICSWVILLTIVWLINDRIYFSTTPGTTSSTNNSNSPSPPFSPTQWQQKAPPIRAICSS